MQFPNFQIFKSSNHLLLSLRQKQMDRNRTETRWFIVMIIFLIAYGAYLFLIRSILLSVENKYQVDIFKPEPVQVFMMSLLILIFHFGLLGLYFFSLGSQWKKIVGALIGLLLPGSLLYGFNEWYQLSANPFLQFNGTQKLPWYAGDKTKFILVNIPIVFYLLIVFILRVLMIFKEENPQLQ